MVRKSRCQRLVALGATDVLVRHCRLSSFRVHSNQDRQTRQANPASVCCLAFKTKISPPQVSQVRQNIKALLSISSTEARTEDLAPVAFYAGNAKLAKLSST